MSGFIKLYRDKILNMPWYTNAISSRLFFHLLLTANHSEGFWEGVKVERGQRVAGYEALSRELNISYQQARTAMSKLKLTGTVTVKTYPKFSVVTLIDYDYYQTDNSQNNTLLTGDQQAINRQVTANKEEEVITKNDNKDIYAFFESIWKLYPEKKGKGSVKLTQKKKLYKLGFDTIAECISRYKGSKPDWQQWQNGGRFFNSGYIDYLDENYLASETKQERKLLE